MLAVRWSLRSLRHVSLVPFRFFKGYERWHTELCYRHIFWIFMMCLMCLIWKSTFLIRFMWSSWMMYKLERTWQLSFYHWGLKIMKWSTYEEKRSLKWRLFGEVLLVAVWRGELESRRRKSYPELSCQVIF